ncbi:MAG: hypothetical protein V4635_10665 [Bacteroidota bacterium]
MIRFNLQLLPENPSDKTVSQSNAAAEQGCTHIVNLIGDMKCKKHPSFKNVINIISVKGKDPKAEIVRICCQQFYDRLG